MIVFLPGLMLIKMCKYTPWYLKLTKKQFPLYMDIFELLKLMIDRLWIKLSLKLLQHSTRPVHDTNDQTISYISCSSLFQQVSKTDSLS